MIIYFSGGKDSLAVLHQYKDDPKLSKVFFCDTGHSYPHMLDFVINTCEKFKVPLQIISPKIDIDLYQEQFGLPSDIIPITRSPEFIGINKKKQQKIQSLFSCCSSLFWNPLKDAVLAGTDRIVFRGIKEADEHGTVGGDFIDDMGIRWVNPIWTCSDDEVFAYLKENQIELASHYKETRSGFHCLYCTAHTHSSNDNERLTWTKKHYPKLWPRIKERFERVNLAIKEESDIRNISIGNI